MPELEEQDKAGNKEQEDVFMILSHPVRRRILQEMFEEGSISFTTMSKEWGLSTGVIYHHLKLLKPLIKQENKKYVLTEKGYEVCEWFLKTKSGRVKIEKVSFFNHQAYLIFYFISQHRYPVATIILLLWGLSAYLASSVTAIVLGPLFFSQSVIQERNQLLIVSVLGTSIGLILDKTFLMVTGKKGFGKIIANYLFSLLFTTFSIMFLFAINLLGMGYTPRFLWILLITLSQIWFIIVNTLGFSNYYSISLEKSALFSIVVLYFYLFFSFVFLSL